jgi:hypothetical protein
VVVGLHGDSPPLPLELGTRQRCHRHRCHHSPYESASPVSVPTQRALVLSRLDPYAASIKLGPTTHHVDACSAWRNLMAATPKVHEPAVATSHLLVPKETKPSNSISLAESRCGMAGDGDAPISKKQPEEIFPDQVSRARALGITIGIYYIFVGYN